MRTFIDLFAGAGLFSAGFAAADFRPILAIEIDPFAVESYRRNVAAVAKCASVERVQGGIYCDVLIAGPPCQGFSSLGPRDPGDRRNRLCLAIVRWAEATNARVVVVENVVRFLHSSQWRRMTAALRKADYDVEVWTLNAADHGAPQQRLRSFTIASKIGIPETPKRGKRVAAGAAFRNVRRGDPMHVWPQPSSIAAARFAKVPDAGDRRDILARAPDLCPPSWSKLGCQATDGWGRIDAEQPANTLKSRFQNPSTGRYLHPTANRVISLREGARLQGVPDDWVFVGNREAIVRQIGNGVPIPLGRAVAAQIALLFDRQRRKERSVA
jgi:DNA (cytosine-5)-methyltransferase 1